jgi:hypothetical protein
MNALAPIGRQEVISGSRLLARVLDQVQQPAEVRCLVGMITVAVETKVWDGASIELR